MKKYFCDVCETGLPEWDDATVLEPTPAVLVGQLSELCPRCRALTRTFDVKALVRDELKRLVESSKKDSAPPNSAPVPSPKGKAAREKRAILAAIETYRKVHGLGFIQTLAELSEVNESTIRAMLLCEPVQIADWRKVGRALGVDKADEGRNANL